MSQTKRFLITFVAFALCAAAPVGGGGNNGTYNLNAFDISNSGTKGVTMGVSPPIERTTAQRAADMFNVRDYGALGTNSQTTVGTTGCFASFSAFSGSNCYPWATNPTYGLTFSLTIPTGNAGSASGQNSLSFLLSGGGWNNSTANIAAWQGESNSNAPVVGMAVSNGTGTTCIPSGATVTGVNGDPSGTFSSSGVTYGSITLSSNLVAACSAGNVVNFTISTSQLQSLTQDWLGIQNAVANAESQTSIGNSNTSATIVQNTGGGAHSGGARVFFPAGIYYVNYPIKYSAADNAFAYEVPSILFEGDNWVTSLIKVPTSAPMMGIDSCVIQANAPNGLTGTNFSNLRLSSSAGTSFGSFPVAYSGFCPATGTRLEHVAASGFYAGVRMRESSIKMFSSEMISNGYGVYFSPYSNQTGSDGVKDTDFNSNTIAAIGVSTTNQVDADEFDNLHVYGNPFGFYREPKQSNVTLVDNVFLSNTQIRSFYNEQTGNGFIYVDGSNSTGGLPDAGISGVTFLGGYTMDTGGYTNTPGSGCASPAPAYRYSYWSAKPAPATIYLSNFQNNTMISTVWGSVYAWPCSFSAKVVIDATGVASGNMWINDPSFVGGLYYQGAFLSMSPISVYNSINTVLDNKFEYNGASGVFYNTKSGVTIAGGAPVQFDTQDGYETVINNFSPGGKFAGVAAAPSGNGSGYGVVPVFKSGTQLPMLTTSTSGGISAPQSLYPTAGGFAPTFSTLYGVATNDYATAGSGAVTLGYLDPGQKSGGPVVMLSQTATGSGGSGQFAISADFTEFTGGASAQFILSNQIPAGASEKVCNDNTSGSLTGYPPSGATFGGSATTVTLAAGTCATYTKMSATKWSVN